MRAVSSCRALLVRSVVRRRFRRSRKTLLRRMPLANAALVRSQPGQPVGSEVDPFEQIGSRNGERVPSRNGCSAGSPYRCDGLQDFFAGSIGVRHTQMSPAARLARKSTRRISRSYFLLIKSRGQLRRLFKWVNHRIAGYSGRSAAPLL